MTLPTRIRSVGNVLGIVLLIALVAPFVVYAVPGVIGADYSFVVLTASMTPAIAPGDVVVVADRDPATVVEGDVITFVRGESEVPVTHRVIGVADGPDGLAFETQGDANEAPDAGVVPAANLVGVVALTIPYIGYVIQFADSPVGFAALVVVPFGLLLLTEAWSLYRSRTGGGAAGAATGSTGSGSVETDDREGAAGSEGETGAEGETGSDAGGMALTPETVTGAVAVLVPVAPYAAYVAYTLRTALSVSVAVATAASALFGVVLLVSARRGADDPSPPPSDEDRASFEPAVIEATTDGGSSEEGASGGDGEIPSANSTPEADR